MEPPAQCGEVWALNPNVGEAAEVLHRSFLKHLLGVRICTANEIVLASVIYREKQWVTFKYLHDDSHSSLLLYWTLQP